MQSKFTDIFQKRNCSTRHILWETPGLKVKLRCSSKRNHKGRSRVESKVTEAFQAAKRRFWCCWTGSYFNFHFKYVHMGQQKGISIEYQPSAFQPILGGGGRGPWMVRFKWTSFNIGIESSLFDMVSVWVRAGGCLCVVRSTCGQGRGI